MIPRWIFRLHSRVMGDLILNTFSSRRQGGSAVVPSPGGISRALTRTGTTRTLCFHASIRSMRLVVITSSLFGHAAVTEFNLSLLGIGPEVTTHEFKEVIAGASAESRQRN